VQRVQRVLRAPASPVGPPVLLLFALVQMREQEQMQAPIPVHVQVHESLWTAEQGPGHPLVLRKRGWACRQSEGEWE
jgi:hypothetical protein